MEFYIIQMEPSGLVNGKRILCNSARCYYEHEIAKKGKLPGQYYISE